ncbi:hypothetical protein TL16_g06233 [Triparma laevis f. inornata]|uniref:Uncharacterized protein n=1 Tax=Triparma laevis f. inornata TaxID=1714386 RepID=A0A9W7EC90_9STRA|nr:hypothetical protein TL16_g06233 [Triparma laevis f. inornata]
MDVDPKEPTVKKVATPAPEPQPEPEPTTIQTSVAKIQDALPISPVLSPPSAPTYLNCRISVYWPKMRKYYQGRVGAEVSDGKVSVTFDDGDVEYLDLDKERWTMIQEPDYEHSSVEPEPEVEPESESEPKFEPETITGLPWTEKETAVLLAGVASHGKDFKKIYSKNKSIFKHRKIRALQDKHYILTKPKPEPDFFVTTLAPRERKKAVLLEPTMKSDVQMLRDSGVFPQLKKRKSPKPKPKPSPPPPPQALLTRTPLPPNSVPNSIDLLSFPTAISALTIPNSPYPPPLPSPLIQSAPSLSDHTDLASKRLTQKRNREATLATSPKVLEKLDLVLNDLPRDYDPATGSVTFADYSQKEDIFFLTFQKLQAIDSSTFDNFDKFLRLHGDSLRLRVMVRMLKNRY